MALRKHIENYPYCEITYRVDSAGKDKTRLRVTAGMYGMDHVFGKGDDSLGEITRFLEEHQATKIRTAKPADTFFM